LWLLDSSRESLAEKSRLARASNSDASDTEKALTPLSERLPTLGEVPESGVASINEERPIVAAEIWNQLAPPPERSSFWSRVKTRWASTSRRRKLVLLALVLLVVLAIIVGVVLAGRKKRYAVVSAKFQHGRHSNKIL